MDEDHEGVCKQVAGPIKQAIGKVTGDTKIEAEGPAEKAASKIQMAFGGAHATVRNAVKN